MGLFQVKWLAALIIFIVTLLTGLLSTGFTVYFRRYFRIADAVANGVFIGVAFFHLLPESIATLQEIQVPLAWLFAITLLLLTHTLFVFIEKEFLRGKKTMHLQFTALAVVLPLHAAIAGFSLGVAASSSLVSILFIAIIAHKSFETFAFVLNLRKLNLRGLASFVFLFIFSLVTPLGILLGALGEKMHFFSMENLLSACLAAISAGTFLYIGVTHVEKFQSRQDTPTQQYIRAIATFFGVLVMGIVGIWV